MQINISGMSGKTVKIIPEVGERTGRIRGRRGRPVTKIIVSNTQLTENPNLGVDESLLNNVPSTQDTTQTTTGQTSENTESQSNTNSTEASPTKVYYIASQDGSIASYNPNYILRKTGGTEFRILLPDKAGTIALIEDVESTTKEYILKKDIFDMVNRIEEENPIDEQNYTIDDIVKSYKALLKGIKDLTNDSTD